MAVSKERIRDCVAEPLFDLPKSEVPILATEEVVRQGVIGVGKDFREGAGKYDERYFDTKGQKDQLNLAYRSIGRHISQEPRVALDIGCGSGNASFAMLELFPSVEILATDLSPEMLTIFGNRAREIGYIDRVSLVVADASTLKLAPDAFDLIVGSSMVHHLVDPDVFLVQTLTALRKDGVAIFGEPFQSGYFLLRGLLIAVVKMAEQLGGFKREHLDFMTFYAGVIETMCQEGSRDTEFFRSLEDKWMFLRRVFTDAAAKSGCRVTIVPTSSPTSMFKTQISRIIFNATGDRIEYPQWAEEFLNDMDRLVTPGLRDEILLAGCIIYEK